ncbi:MAG: hypothetical protein IMX00_01715 [Limnochordales bacterium]|nr:hypothetical protein [Limnochordales bacterium]
MPAKARTSLWLVPFVMLLLVLAGLPVKAAAQANMIQGQTVLVDLEPYFNNDGVATEEDPVDGNLDGIGWSLMAEEMPPAGSIIQVKDVFFRIPETRAPFVKNNMVFYNQKVEVPAGKYYDAYFLSTATGGAKRARLTFVYADGERVEAELRVSDWAGQPQPTEVVAVRMSGRYNVLGKQDLPVSLYATAISLNPNKELVRIEFPEQVNIHLFALSLGLAPNLLPIEGLEVFREPISLPVDLRAHFNQDGVSTLANPADGNFDGVGWNLAAELMPPAGQVVKLAGVEWLMPEYADGLLNNIQARGQRLPLPKGMYSGLYILATATGGGQTGKLTVNYADGSTQTVDIRVSDWCGEPSFGEEVAWEMAHRYDRNGPTGPATRLFRVWWKLDASREIESVVLPNNPSIHIFALTLGLPADSQ